MKNWNVDYLKNVRLEEAQALMKGNNDLRHINRHYNNGYTKDKSMRRIGRINMAAVMSHPEMRKYFDPQQDPHEFRKSVYKFLKKYDDCRVVDKL